MPTEARRPIVAGNWKMNGNPELLLELQEALGTITAGQLDIVICPPSVFLANATNKSFALGAQNVSPFASGAYTGEISVEMVKACGADYCIVGHSERRELFGESNQLVAEKVAAVLAQGLTPIFCVGESLEIREQGNLFDFLAQQLNAVIQHIGIEKMANLVIAYEPIWAIGTGKTASPAQAQEVHEFIRSHLANLSTSVAEQTRILYGGSVNAANADSLFSQPDVDGGLVGGASLKTDEFVKICQAANK